MMQCLSSFSPTPDVLQEMKAVASNIQGLEDDLELEDETQSDWDGSRFAHDPMQWMSSGARMRDLWNASEQRFQVIIRWF